MLDVKDYLRFKITASDDSYLYGIRSGRAEYLLYRLTGLEDDPASAIYDFTAGAIKFVWIGVNPGQIFVSVRTNTNLEYIYKSNDYGATFGNNAPYFNNGGYVLALGDTDGTVGNQISGVSALQRAFCAVGNKCYCGEYNINESRVNGGANDAVRVWESDDYGATWVAAVEWNTDGTHYTRHVHAVQPHGGNIYISVGDSNDESGIIMWDGVSALPSNQAIATYDDVFTGAQRYRTGDILFPAGDFMFWMADSASSADDRGIWKGRKDMTGTPARVDSQILAFDNHSGWYGVILPDGNLVFSEFIEAGAVDRQINFYGSDDGGATWSITNKYGCSTTVNGGANNFFIASDGIFYIKSGGAGKNWDCDSVVLEQAENEIYWPVIVHPVYWVGLSGTDDSSHGYNPALPWRTVKYAMTSSKITNGGRVIVGAGEFAETAISAVWDANAVPGYALAETVIEGAGKAETIIYETSGDALDYLYNIPKDCTPLIFRKLNCHTRKNNATAQTLIAATQDVYKGDITIEDSIFGSKTYTARNVVSVRTPVVVDRSILLGDPLAKGLEFVNSSTAASKASVRRSVLDGFYDGVVGQGAANLGLSIVDSDVINYARTGVRLITTNTVVPEIKNVAFDGTGNSYWDEGSLTETDAKIDYNYYGNPVNRCANNGGANSISGTDPLIDAVLYRTGAKSMCLKRGTSVSGVNDGGEVDIWGNVTPASGLNIGADQQDYAPGFGPWVHFDGTLTPPTALDTSSSVADVMRVITFTGSPSSAQITKMVELGER